MAALLAASSNVPRMLIARCERIELLGVVLQSPMNNTLVPKFDVGSDDD